MPAVRIMANCSHALVVRRAKPSDRNFSFLEIVSTDTRTKTKNRVIEYQYRDDEILTWELGKAINRWVYLFCDNFNGKNRVWEIQTNDFGKFNINELFETENSETEKSNKFVGFVALPKKDNFGTSLKYYAMLSEFPLSKKRIFDKKDGIINNPNLRCADLSNDEYAYISKREHSNVEAIGLVNHIQEGIRRNAKYRDTLDEYIEHRYNLKNDNKSIIETFNKVTREPEYSDNAYTQKARLTRLTASLVLSICGGKPKYGSKLSYCLKDNGSDFNHYIEAMAKPEIHANIKLRTALSSLKTFIQRDGYKETTIDYLFSDTPENDNISKILEYESKILYRLDEHEEGLKTLNNFIKSDPPIIGEKSGLINRTGKLIENNKLAKKGIKGTLSITAATIKVISSRAELAVENKKVLIESLLKNSCAMNLKITEKIIKNSDTISISNFPSATSATSDIKIDIMKLDDVTIKRYREIEGIDYKLSSLIATLDAVSLINNSYKLYKNIDTTTSYNTIKNITSLFKWATEDSKTGKKIVKNSKFLSLKVIKKVNHSVTMVTGVVDAVLCGVSAYNEFNEGDIDKAVFDTTEGVGHAFLGAAGICYLTGVGAPIGGALTLIGIILVTTGGVGGMIVDDTAVERFLKNTPWGNGSDRSWLPFVTDSNVEQNCNELKEGIVKFLQNIFAFKADLQYGYRLEITPKFIHQDMEIIVKIEDSKIKLNSRNTKIENGKIIYLLGHTTVKTWDNIGYSTVNKNKVEVQIDMLGTGELILPKDNEFLIVK